MRRRSRAAAVAVALCLPLPALAHPHVLIDSHIVLRFEAGKIVDLQMGWKFDAVYSGSLLQDFDKNKDGKLSTQELAAMEQDAFQDTAQYSYFTHARVDGKPLTWPKAEGFQVIAQKDGLIYAFRLRLPAPVDPRQQDFRLSTYEETYYIDIDFPNDGAVRLIGDGAEGCRATMSPDLENTLLGGVVTPKKVEIACAP